MIDLAGLPYSDEAEMGTLCCVLNLPGLVTTASRDVLPEHFYNPANRLLFETLVEMDGQGRPIGNREVSHFLLDTQRMDKVGGLARVGELFNGFPIPSQFPYFASILRDKFIQRSGIEIFTRGIHRIYEASPLEPTAWAAEALAELMKLQVAAMEQGRRGGQTFKQLGASRLGELLNPKARGIPTGFQWLDDMTGGLRGGKKWTIAGGHSDGKSSLALQIGLYAANAGAPGSIYTLEMPGEEVWERAASQEARVGSNLWKHCIVNHRQKEALDAFIQTIYPIKVFDDLDRWDEIMASLAIEKAERGIQWAILDYLQLGQGDKRNGREQEIASMSGASKRAAKRLNITIIELSQLNDDGKLRESRSIGADADLVAKIELVPKEDSKRILFLEKNRGGPRHKRCVYDFTGEYFIFNELGELTTQPEPEEQPQQRWKSRK